MELEELHSLAGAELADLSALASPSVLLCMRAAEGLSFKQAATM